MHVTEGFFENNKGQRLHYHGWHPSSGEVRGVLIIVHGAWEHALRYKNVINKVVPEGLVVWSYDHRGHGQSEGRPIFVDSFDDYLDDLSLFEHFVREQHPPSTPTHLLGHSMGSAIATHYMAGRANQSMFTSLVLSGTGASVGPEVKSSKRLAAKVFSKLLPKIYMDSGVQPEFISHDKSVVEEYINDPFVAKKSTPRFGAELIKAMDSMASQAKKIIVPTLVQIGSEDTAFAPESRQVLFDALPTTEKELKIYQGLRHEVYNEVEKDKVLDDLLRWLLSRSS